MKRYLILALLLAFITAGAFATDVGVGLMFGIGSRTSHDYNGYDDREYTSSDFGLTGFFGWKYFDFILGLSSITASGEVSYNYIVFHTGFDFKIPITISNKIRIYPMIGFDFACGDGLEFYTFGPHGGIGADFLLFGNMFVRGNLLYDYHYRECVVNDTMEMSGIGGNVLIKACAGWRF
ncbi:hypothetical protein R84B8_00124 [Treponema sp. R8-4-B8]